MKTRIAVALLVLLGAPEIVEAAPMRCTNQSRCTGESVWHRSPAGRHSRSSIKVAIHTYYR